MWFEIPSHNKKLEGKKMNELLFLVEMILVFVMVVLAKKFFGKEGLFIWIAIASILANIQVTRVLIYLELVQLLEMYYFHQIF